MASLISMGFVCTCACLLLVLAPRGVACGRGGQRVVAESKPCAKVVDGAGVSVLRCLGGDQGGVRRALDPFLVFDAYRISTVADLGGGFPAHAHRGFTELRYLLAGSLHHKDSCENEAVTDAGGVQLFFAGKGAAHEEKVTPATSPPSRFLFEGFQVWVNAPAVNKSNKPVHNVFPAGDFPLYVVPGNRPYNAPPSFVPSDSAKVKVLSGRFGGVDGPITSFVKGLLFLDVTEIRGGRDYDPLEVHFHREDQHVIIYVYRGRIQVGPKDVEGSQTVSEGQFVPLTPGLSVSITGADKHAAASFVLLTAPRVSEPVFVGSGFAMDTRERLDEAVEDLKQGRAASCG